MPPRHGKSALVSHWLPVWYFAMWPHSRVMLTSYEADFAASWGRMVRQSITEHSKTLGIALSRDSSAANRWHLAQGGSMVTAGVGGPLTGRGGQLIIVDDPVKNFDEAYSERYRQRTWDWYTSTLRTRLEPGGCIVVVMTRWHELDLAGKIRANAIAHGTPFVEIVLPAIAESDDDPLGRSPGEPLWPERYDAAALQKIRDDVGELVWAGLFQQRPSPLEGSMVKKDWLRWWRQLPKRFDEVIQSWDLAFKGDADSSYVVGQVWGRVGADCYLLEQFRSQVDFPATLAAFETMTEKWPRARTKLVEDKANGAALIATLGRKIPGIVAIKPKGAKEARLLAVSAALESGNVYLPDPSMYPWVERLVAELLTFPRAAHDDQVDALTQALSRLTHSAIERLRRLAAM